MSASIVLEWRNLNLVVEKEKFEVSSCTKTSEEKRILDNVSGSLKSGQLVAIMGPSGAGKTTLLAGISQRFRGPLTGRISVNGIQIDRKTMTSISCFVPQFDVTMKALTAKEHLYFMAELKMDRRWSKARKASRIQLLLNELGLAHVADNRISTLSGGERKKLDLAVDLLTNPPIIFCDEPTTGLDSFNARKVIEALKYLSGTGKRNETPSGSNTDDSNMELLLSSAGSGEQRDKAIICSIHQPTSEIFQCFTHVILMYGGRCVFHGTSDDAIIHFSKLGFECPASYNPADFYMKVLSNTTNNDESSSQTFFKRPVEMVRQSTDFQPQSIQYTDSFNVNEYKIRSPLWIGQVWLLIHRSMLNLGRSYREIIIDTLWYILPYIISAILYHQSTGQTQETTRDVLGVFFLLSCGIIFTSCYSVMNFYHDRLPILRRETNEHIYKFSAYYVAELVNALPMSFLRAFSALTVVYTFSAFNQGYEVYLQLWLTLFLAGFTANAYGLMMSNLFRIAITDVASITDLIFMCISGFYINLSAFPYLRYVSFFFYTNEASAIIFFSRIQTIDCAPKFDGKCFGNGDDVLRSLSYRTDVVAVYYDYIGLMILAAIMHIIAFICTRRNIRSVGYY